jgi:hypothetical protein
VTVCGDEERSNRRTSKRDPTGELEEQEHEQKIREEGWKR